MKLIRRNIVVVVVVALVAGATPSAGFPAGGPRPSKVPFAGAGVTAQTIKIGLHGPMTGASPLPSDSLDKGARLYWRWRRAKNNPINDRHVRVEIRNDNYNPSQAVAVCKELVEQEKVFMLSGLMNPEGKDQVQACARYAASVGVPYVALGQTKIGLSGLPNFFTVSMPWPEQARLLADFFIERLGGKRRKNGMIRHDTPNYQDTHESFARAMRRRNQPLEKVESVSKRGSMMEAETVIQEMKAARIRNIFALVTPVFFLQLLDAADRANYGPQWAGIGITMSVTDSVVDVGCRGDEPIKGAKFFSPVPAFADRNKFDGTYAKAMRRIYNGRGDAVTWLGWATSRHLAQLLKRAGRDLSRKRFMRRVERAKRVRTGIMPGVSFRHRDHFGGRAVHVLRANCRQGRWQTRARFKRNF